VLQQQSVVATRGSGGRSPSRRRQTGVRGQSSRC